MESIGTALLPPNNTHLHEVGLPVLVSLPRGQKLMPGEIVDLRVIAARPSYY